MLVIGEDYEEQLAPYDEGITVAPYRDYFDDEMLAFYRKQYTDARGIGPGVSDEDVAKFLNEKWGDGNEEYRVDEKGLYRLSTYNPNSKWDWYSVGGRWTGYFKVKQGVAVGASQLGESGTFNNEPDHDADIVRKSDVDIAGMRKDAGDKAWQRWDLAQDVFGDLPEANPWSSFLDRVKQAERDGDEVYSIDVAREQYRTQPRVEALRKADEEIRWRDVEEFQVTRDEYVKHAELHALPTYAYVKDGEWFAPGNMGWWGMSSETQDENERFAREFNEMFDALPDDTLLTLVDCHI